MRRLWGGIIGRQRIKALGFATLIAFLIIQCVETTRFGIDNGRLFRAANVTTARVVVNLDRIPQERRACYFESTVVGPPLFALQQWQIGAMRNHLTVFQSTTRRVYRAQGTPTIAQCDHPIHVITSTLPHGRVGVSYSTSLTATGGKPPFVWSVAPDHGLLPKGLKLNPSTGVISGIPKDPGFYTFSVSVGEGRTSTSRSDVNYPNEIVVTIS